MVPQVGVKNFLPDGRALRLAAGAIPQARKLFVTYPSQAHDGVPTRASPWRNPDFLDVEVAGLFTKPDVIMHLVVGPVTDLGSTKFVTGCVGLGVGEYVADQTHVTFHEPIIDSLPGVSPPPVRRLFGITRV